MPRSDDVRITCNDHMLAGTLYTPGSPAPWPGVVMVAGSGAVDRDSGGYFPPIRDSLISAGLAVLSWDKPGVGESTGNWHDQTFADRAAEAKTALFWLRDHPEIKRSVTGVWGHSQGGWVAQMVAADDTELAFAVLSSAPGVDVIAQDRYGVEHVLRRRGASELNIREGVGYIDRLHAAARAGMSYERFAVNVMESARGSAGFDYFGEIDAGFWRFLTSNLRNPYLPASALARIRCPLLAVFGEQDDLVPIQESIDVYHDALKHNPDVSIHVVPDANHRIMTGNPPRLADGYLGMLTSWLAQHIGNATEKDQI